MSRSSSGRSVEAEAERLNMKASEALQRGELSIDEFDAISHLVDAAESGFLEGEFDRVQALDVLHRAEQRLQEAL